MSILERALTATLLAVVTAGMGAYHHARALANDIRNGWTR